MVQGAIDGFKRKKGKNFTERTGITAKGLRAFVGESRHAVPPDTDYNFHSFKCLAMAPVCCSLSTDFVCSTKVHSHAETASTTGLHLKHAFFFFFTGTLLFSIKLFQWF